MGLPDEMIGFFDGHNLVATAYGWIQNEDKRLAGAMMQVLTSANEKFEEIRIYVRKNHRSGILLIMRVPTLGYQYL